MTGSLDIYAFLLCRQLVVGLVLKWLALFIHLFLRVQSPGHTFGYFWLKNHM